MAGSYVVSFDDDPARFLDRAVDHLASEPVTSTVIATVANRMATASGHTGDAPYAWFAVVIDEAGEIVGIAMRTAPFAPYPPFLLAMPEGAVVALADAVVDRGEEVGGVNGALPAAAIFADRVAERTGRAVVVAMHTRLFELGTLVTPTPARGRLRPAYDGEAPLALEWFHQFSLDADEQAGHEGRDSRAEGTTLEAIRDRIDQGQIWMWVDDGDVPRHLTAVNPPTYGVARLGPVYTPKGHRGRGYASSAVAEVARLLQQEGSRVTLFTDQANPTSNGIYVALGFEPVVDMVELAIG